MTLYHFYCYYYVPTTTLYVAIGAGLCMAIRGVQMENHNVCQSGFEENRQKACQAAT